MLKSYSLNRILALVAGGGFFFMMIDSTIEHWDILAEEWMAYIPILFSAVGAILGAIAVLKWNETWIRLLHVFLLASFLVAAGGLYFHLAEEDEDEMTEEKMELEATEKEKPPLAPLAFGGLALVGLLGTARKWNAEVR
jgi:hypothetical protein